MGAKKYRATPRVFPIDLAGNGTLQFPERNVFCLVGFSAKALQTMRFLEEDKSALLREIEPSNCEGEHKAGRGFVCAGETAHHSRCGGFSIACFLTRNAIKRGNCGATGKEKAGEEREENVLRKNRDIMRRRKEFPNCLNYPNRRYPFFAGSTKDDKEYFRPFLKKNTQALPAIAKTIEGSE